MYHCDIKSSCQELFYLAKNVYNKKIYYFVIFFHLTNMLNSEFSRHRRKKNEKITHYILFMYLLDWIFRCYEEIFKL